MSNESVANDKADFDAMSIIDIIRKNNPVSAPVDRKTELLEQVLEMFKQCDESTFEMSPFDAELFYDGADCDGYCLRDDIASELGVDL
jgi:hypothetical protein